MSQRDFGTKKSMGYKYLVILTLIAVTLAAYWRVGDNDFISLDDPEYVVQNPHVQTVNLENIGWAFTSTEQANWHPLTWLSHMADCQLFGLNPRGHHLTNVFLHIANAVLLFLLLCGTTGTLWRSAFVAALFALHPLHVESVAWVAERKDVLSTLFFMLTLLAYAWYVAKPGLARYALTFCSFALGLMAKSMLVTLPFVLLLLDYWPLGRYRLKGAAGNGESEGHMLRQPLPGKLSLQRLILEKIPFFMLSAGCSILTLHAQEQGGAMVPLEAAPLSFRIENAVVAYVEYVGKMFWPSRLAIFYPSAQLPTWQILASALLLAGMTVAVFRWARRFPFLPVGWLWFLGTLVPVIGLVQVGIQSMADRYTYIPLIGLFIMVTWGVPELVKGVRYHRIALSAAGAVTIAVLSVGTWLQAGHWQNNVELFSHALKFNNDNYMAHLDLGIALADRGRYDEAISHYNEFLRINPDYEVTHYFLGVALQKQGKLAEAIMQYSECLRLNPNDMNARSLLESALAEQRNAEGHGRR